MIEQIKDKINTVEGFPVDGVSFKDISPLLSDYELFGESVFRMSNLVQTPDYWVGIESRGFPFVSVLSMMTERGFVMCRKKDKLPPPKISHSYSLEYGEDTLEIKPGKGTVVIVDDVLATGGTMNAAEELAKKAGYDVIGKLVLINLKYLNNIQDVKYLISYE